MRQFGTLSALVFLAACAVPATQTAPDPEPENAAPEAALPKPAAPPPSARTVEQFDTTTAEERAEVVKAAATPAQDRALGTTVASLGDPTDPGFWLKTPLVSSEQPGRVTYPAAGTSVAVTLIPIDGPSTGGSRLSLPAMRLLQAPLTGLPEVTVFAR
ncbi:hypothetical protein [Cognatishimia sp. MH4019]|uniref:hypothetical protein n=1 Tax=Cognatishimia sp. MH4019 TaxID=2854030 RepID=UPI001CD61D39|nr:hypothetical protein [Cognatishimia sp. MH4019]